MFGNNGKTEKATPRRREEARKRGTVVRSIEIVNALAMMALILVMPTALAMFWTGSQAAIRMSFQTMRKDVEYVHLQAALLNSLTPLAPPLLMVLGTMMVVGVLGNVAQVGFKPSLKILSPSLAKLNPLEGIKRILSAHGILETLKILAKSLIFGILAYNAVVAAFPLMASLSTITPVQAAGEVGELIKSIAGKIVGAWAVLAAIDYFIQRKETEERLKMSLQEVKREMKDDMGDPIVRGERMRRFKRRMRNAVSAAAEADVVITNPTHYAVAIRYEQGKHAAPIVVAKGVDAKAAKIREIAEGARVPLVANPPLARALYKQCEVGDPVPRELFLAVAEVLAYVYQTLKRVRR